MEDEEIEHAKKAARIAAAYCAGKPIIDERGNNHRRVSKESKAHRIENWVVEHRNTPLKDAPGPEHNNQALSQKQADPHQMVVRGPPPRHPLHRIAPSPQPIPVLAAIPTPAPVAVTPISAARERHSKWRSLRSMFNMHRTRTPSTTPSSARTPSLSWQTTSPVSSVRGPRTPAQNPVVDDGVMNGVNAKLSALELDGGERKKGPLRVINHASPTGVSVTVEA